MCSAGRHEKKSRRIEDVNLARVVGEVVRREEFVFGSEELRV